MCTLRKMLLLAWAGGMAHWGQVEQSCVGQLSLSHFMGIICLTSPLEPSEGSDWQFADDPEFFTMSSHSVCWGCRNWRIRLALVIDFFGKEHNV